MTLKSREARGREGVCIIGWLASRWPENFSGTNGRLLRSLKEHRRLGSTSSDACCRKIKKKRKGKASVPRATAACQDPTPLNLPSQTAGHHRDQADLQTWCLRLKSKADRVAETVSFEGRIIISVQMSLKSGKRPKQTRSRKSG